MIGKLILLPFRLLGGSLKLVLTLAAGILGLLFKNSIGVIIGLIGGVFLAKKQMDAECCCESDDELNEESSDESENEDKKENTDKSESES